MAKIVITKKGNNGILVDFGDYANMKLPSPQGFHSETFEHVKKIHDSNEVRVITVGRDRETWKLAHTATTDCMVVDTINAVAPISAADLVEKLTELM